MKSDNFHDVTVLNQQIFGKITEIMRGLVDARRGQ